MSPEETDILEFLRNRQGSYVSVSDISRSVGLRKRFLEDRHWTRPILRRMEMDGWVESNELAEYRLAIKEESTTNFWKALEQPNRALGDTTIIEFGDVEPAETQRQNS